jgi:hypothetical protein
MMCRVIRRAGVFGVAWLICAATSGWAEVLRVTELTAPQLRTLDRSTTLVVLTGGMIEEHGPYLPTSTDGRYRGGYRVVAPVRPLVTAKDPSSLALTRIQLDVASVRLAM